MICQSKHTAGMESRKNRGERMKHRKIWIIIAGVVLIVAGALGVWHQHRDAVGGGDAVSGGGTGKGPQRHVF